MCLAVSVRAGDFLVCEVTLQVKDRDVIVWRDASGNAVGGVLEHNPSSDCPVRYRSAETGRHILMRIVRRSSFEKSCDITK